jgi:glycogen synthase
VLFPIDWPEPFGLVMIEAAARGTPVLAYRRGSVEEVIDEGVTGMVVDDADQAVAALPTLLGLPRAGVRRAVEERFSVARMAQGYVEVYERLMTTMRREDAALAIRNGQPRITTERVAVSDLATMNGGTVPDEVAANG